MLWKGAFSKENVGLKYLQTDYGFRNGIQMTTYYVDILNELSNVTFIHTGGGVQKFTHYMAVYIIKGPFDKFLSFSGGCLGKICL